MKQFRNTSVFEADRTLRALLTGGMRVLYSKKNFYSFKVLDLSDKVIISFSEKSNILRVSEDLLK